MTIKLCYHFLIRLNKVRERRVNRRLAIRTAEEGKWRRNEPKKNKGKKENPVYQKRAFLYGKHFLF